MKFKWNNKEWYIDGFLASQLDSIAYNIKKDWDFMVIITGDRSVRTGKSTIAMTVSAYLDSVLNTGYTLDNIHFSSDKMIEIAMKLPRYSIIHYDEGREALASSKYSQAIQQELLDYFAECGQLNHVFIVVLPDFFNLVEEIAVARSECLINVYRDEKKIMKNIDGSGLKPIVKLGRGYFQFFNRYKKQELYDKAKRLRRKDYGLVRPNFLGRFTNQYPIDEQLYRQKKLEYLTRFRDYKGKGNADILRNNIVFKMSEQGLKPKQISARLLNEYSFEMSERHILRLVKHLYEKWGSMAIGGDMDSSQHPVPVRLKKK